MNLRTVGAIFIVAGCGGFGLSMAAEQLRQLRFLKQLQTALKLMELELQFHLTQLPELCAMAGKQAGGVVKSVLLALSRELDRQILPDVSSCMQQILKAQGELSRSQREMLKSLGTSLGVYDLPGQLDGIRALEVECREKRDQLETGRSQRFRNYEILGLCAGGALVILFI